MAYFSPLGLQREKLSRLADEAGISLDFSATMTSSLDSLRLIQWTQRRFDDNGATREALYDRLQQSYFEDGERVAGRATLLKTPPSIIHGALVSA